MNSTATATFVVSPDSKYMQINTSDLIDIGTLCNIFLVATSNFPFNNLFSFSFPEGSWYDANDRGDTSNAFNNWLQCYYQDGMSNVVDHNKRTVWYSGPLGPLAPKGERHNWCFLHSSKNTRALENIIFVSVTKSFFQSCLKLPHKM